MFNKYQLCLKRNRPLNQLNVRVLGERNTSVFPTRSPVLKTKKKILIAFLTFTISIPILISLVGNYFYLIYVIQSWIFNIYISYE